MVYMKNILLSLLLCTAMAAKASERIYTLVNGEKVSRQDIYKALGDISNITPSDIEEKVKHSDLHGKLPSSRFAPSKVPYILDPELRKTAPPTESSLEWLLSSSNKPQEFNRLYLLVNTEEIASTNALNALGKHELLHYQNSEIFRNYRNPSLKKSLLAGAIAGLAPIACQYLRKRTTAASLPVKSMLIIGATTAYGISKGYERQNILAQRNLEIAADKFMISEGFKDKNILTGSLEQFSCDAVKHQLRIAHAQDMWHKKYSWVPRELTNAYVLQRYNWYRQHETPEERIRRVTRAMDHSINTPNKSKVVQEITNCLLENNKVNALAKQYHLSPGKVKRIIKEEQAACINNVSGNTIKEG